MSYYDDITEADVQDFFEQFELDTAVTHDLGYGCSKECTVEELYQMFKARLRMEEMES